MILLDEFDDITALTATLILNTYLIFMALIWKLETAKFIANFEGSIECHLLDVIMSSAFPILSSIHFIIGKLDCSLVTCHIDHICKDG